MGFMRIMFLTGKLYFYISGSFCEEELFFITCFIVCFVFDSVAMCLTSCTSSAILRFASSMPIA